MKTIAAISVKNGQILVDKEGLFTARMKKDEKKPIEALKRKYNTDSLEFLGIVNDVEIYLANPLNANGEWVGTDDKRLAGLEKTIIPHLMWTGLL